MVKGGSSPLEKFGPELKNKNHSKSIPLVNHQMLCGGTSQNTWLLILTKICGLTVVESMKANEIHR